MIYDVITDTDGGTTEVIVNASVVNLFEEVGDPIVLERVPPLEYVVEQGVPGGTNVIEITSEVDLISAGLKFVTTPNEEDMIYAKRTDFVSDTLMYRADAAVGTLDSAPLWRIRKITIAVDGDISETWAGGAATFVNAWNDRATLVYS